MVKNLLVELGLEEMPAYVVTPSMKQLRDKMGAFLTDHRLTFEKIEMFSTPRRLAVRVVGLADKQSDLTEDFKGPSKKIALDADGNFTKAAEGFVRGKGLTVEDITFREIKGEEYVYVTKEEIGRPVEEIIPAVTEVLQALTFPVSMHWANNTFEYIRPVHTLSLIHIFYGNLWKMKKLNTVSNETHLFVHIPLIIRSFFLKGDSFGYE